MKEVFDTVGDKVDLKNWDDEMFEDYAEFGAMQLKPQGATDHPATHNDARTPTRVHDSLGPPSCAGPLPEGWEDVNQGEQKFFNGHKSIMAHTVTKEMFDKSAPFTCALRLRPLHIHSALHTLHRTLCPPQHTAPARPTIACALRRGRCELPAVRLRNGLQVQGHEDEERLGLQPLCAVGRDGAGSG